MFNLFGIKVGKYILFEKRNSAPLYNLPIDSNVRLVTDYNQLRYNTLGIQKSAMERLLQYDTKLLVCFDGDIPLGMMWGHRGSCYIRGPGIPLVQDKNSVYWFWIYTSPEARGRNVFNRLKDAFFSLYNEAHTFTALVEPGNEIMCRQMGKMGFIQSKRFIFFKSRNGSLLFEKCNKSQKNYISFELGNKRQLLII